MRRTTTPDRVLATVLFTDIVESTQLASSLGDRRWQALVARHQDAIRSQLKRFRGREIDTAGDGFFAIFDRPAQAVACAIAIVESVQALGIEVRAGLHVGEVEVSGQGVRGIAVHTGARVAAAAQPSEILVTAMVRDLVAGSDLEFADRGMATLKGIPGEWHLLAVVRPEHAAPPSVADDAERVGDHPGASAWRTRTKIGVGAVAMLGVVAAVAVGSRLLLEPVVPGANTVGRVPTGGTSFDRAVEVGSRPNAIAAGEGSVWVLNFSDQTLSRIDAASGEVIANPAVGGTPTGLAHGAGAIWVTTKFGTTAGDVGSVLRFNARVAQLEQRIEVGNGVEAIAFGGDAVWIADRLNDRLIRIDPNTDSLDEEIPVGRAPGAVAYGAGSVWVTSTLDMTLWRIDPETHEVSARIPLLTSPTALAVSDGAVWVTSEAGDTVTRIDTETNGVVTTLEIGDGPRGVAIGTDAVWIAISLAGELIRVDPTSNSVDATLRVDGSPDAIAVDQLGAVWVAVHEP